ncbi:MAG: protein kinase [Gammaproteobacteria bacterium]|nr:protein kinase [Gammaproteobacteria bacterium]
MMEESIISTPVPEAASATGDQAHSITATILPGVAASTGMKVIIVDDSREYMALVRRLLAREWPDIEVTEYDPEQQGDPTPAFDWSIYDVMLLDYQLGGVTTGLDWLTRYRRCNGFPPTVLMTASGDDYIGVRAIKAGAHDFIKKIDIDQARLAALVRDALRERDARRADGEATTPNLKLQKDAFIVREMRLPQDARTPDGRRIGYRFVRLIGQGATSRVYLAERAGDRQTLVLKVIDVACVKEPQVLQRFVREAELVSAVDSPYVVKFLEHGFTEHYGFIAMEFFTRGDLKQRIEHDVSVGDAVNYLLHIAYGLRAIHALGIVHRDLKPGNIMFRSDDSLALADFGISRRLDETSELTRAGSVLGTPNYISPEQALGHKVDQRSDLYSAGVIFFEMLTGRKPYRAESAAALVYQHVHADIPQLPAPVHHFQPVIDILLAKEPAQRFASADDLIDALRSLVRIQPPAR